MQAVAVSSRTYQNTCVTVIGRARANRPERQQFVSEYSKNLDVNVHISVVANTAERMPHLVPQPVLSSYC